MTVDDRIFHLTTMPRGVIGKFPMDLLMSTICQLRIINHCTSSFPSEVVAPPTHLARSAIALLSNAIRIFTTMGLQDDELSKSITYFLGGRGTMAAEQNNSMDA